MSDTTIRLSDTTTAEEIKLAGEVLDLKQKIIANRRKIDMTLSSVEQMRVWGEQLEIRLQEKMNDLGSMGADKDEK